MKPLEVCNYICKLSAKEKVRKHEANCKYQPYKHGQAKTLSTSQRKMFVDDDGDINDNDYDDNGG